MITVRNYFFENDYEDHQVPIKAMIKGARNMLVSDAAEGAREGAFGIGTEVGRFGRKIVRGVLNPEDKDYVPHENGAVPYEQQYIEQPRYGNGFRPPGFYYNRMRGH